MEINEQELMYKFQMFEQQIRSLQQQLQAVEEAILDISKLNLEMDDLIGKKDSEIFAPIGRGIYAKAKLMSEELLVDIGNKNFVKKTIPETKEIIQNQIKKLEALKEELNLGLENINQELTKTFEESQKEHPHNHLECNCGEDCKCNEECDECECKK
ncbi:MAG TPA: prefoldin subunit alpha [Candidatus Pacearchaeota archaeon]|nr:prefoldin subunit alpha [Candidatus Pacearchaeota archaeon]